MIYCVFSEKQSLRQLFSLEKTEGLFNHLLMSFSESLACSEYGDIFVFHKNSRGNRDNHDPTSQLRTPRCIREI